LRGLFSKDIEWPTEESFFPEVTGPIFAAGHALALLDVKETVRDYAIIKPLLTQGGASLCCGVCNPNHKVGKS
jgi:hypothetical protein